MANESQTSVATSTPAANNSAYEDLAREIVRAQMDAAREQAKAAENKPAPEPRGWSLSYAAIGSVAALIGILAAIWGVANAPLSKLAEIDTKLTQLTLTVAKKDDVPTKIEFNQIVGQVDTLRTQNAQFEQVKAERGVVLDKIATHEAALDTTTQSLTDRVTRLETKQDQIQQSLDRPPRR